jgi:hypothetical protein
VKVLPIVAEAYATAYTKARAEGHTLPDARDVIVAVYRWKGRDPAITREDMFRACAELGLKLADMPHPMPDRARDATATTDVTRKMKPQ